MDKVGNSGLRRYWVGFIMLAVCVKALFVLFQVREFKKPSDTGLIAIENGDTNSYLGPVENLIAHGSYKPDYRMPGIGALYYVFRQFLDEDQSKDMLVILQWLFSGISVYVLALVALQLTGSHTTACWVYVLYLLSGYTAIYTASVSSDSFSVSGLIFQVYFMQRAVEERSYPLLLLSGLFFVWLIFLRPVVAALVPPAALLVYYFWSGRRAWIAILVFFIPFALIEGIWTARNWVVNGNFAPLTNEGLMPAYFTSEVRYDVMLFVQAYGGNNIWWHPGSDIRWFGVWKGGGALDDEGRNAKPPPPYAYVPAYNKDSLQWVSDKIRYVSSGTVGKQDSTIVADLVKTKLARYREAYKDGAPFNYHVLSRLRMLGSVLDQHGAESIIMRPFAQLTMWEKMFKIIQALLFLFSLYLGLIYLVIMRWKWSLPCSLLRIWIPLFTAYTILIYPLAFRTCEWRYLVMIYPFLLLLATHFTLMLLSGTRSWMARSEA